MRLHKLVKETHWSHLLNSWCLYVLICVPHKAFSNMRTVVPMDFMHPINGLCAARTTVDGQQRCHILPSMAPHVRFPGIGCLKVDVSAHGRDTALLRSTVEVHFQCACAIAHAHSHLTRQQWGSRIIGVPKPRTSMLYQSPTRLTATNKAASSTGLAVDGHG